MFVVGIGFVLYKNMAKITNILVNHMGVKSL